jgi:hypothetical protein
MYQFTVTGGSQISGTPTDLYIYALNSSGTIRANGVSRTGKFYLVGGGGGGAAGTATFAGGGGGGADTTGGNITLVADTDYTVTIGGGGSGGILGSPDGSSGGATLIVGVVGAAADGGAGRFGWWRWKGQWRCGWSC